MMMIDDGGGGRHDGRVMLSLLACGYAGCWDSGHVGGL